MHGNKLNSRIPGYTNVHGNKLNFRIPGYTNVHGNKLNSHIQMYQDNANNIFLSTYMKKSL